MANEQERITRVTRSVEPADAPLVLQLSKGRKWLGIAFSLCFVVLGVCVIATSTKSLPQGGLLQRPNYDGVIAGWVLLVLGVVFLVAGLLRFMVNRPAAVLDGTGVRFPRAGDARIDWSQVRQVYLHRQNSEASGFPWPRCYSLCIDLRDRRIVQHLDGREFRPIVGMGDLRLCLDGYGVTPEAVLAKAERWRHQHAAMVAARGNPGAVPPVS